MSERRTRLTLIEELHAQFEARLLANGGVLLPLRQSVDPSPELIEDARRRIQDDLDEEEA
ncbi:MAG: hypothetical protein QM736_15150 [Vicinamibacterales bacterium]